MLASDMAVLEKELTATQQRLEMAERERNESRETSIAILKESKRTDYRASFIKTVQEITEAYDAARAELGRCVEALKKYGRHAAYCSAFPNGAAWRDADAALCNCGLAAALFPQPHKEQAAYPPMPEMLAGETDDQYTDRLTGADGTGRVPYPEHRNRQCSIGYHEECTDPKGERCKCPCHSPQPTAEERSG